MAFFAIHIMEKEDVAKVPIPTTFMEGTYSGFDETVHEAVFFHSAIRFDKYPRLKKLRVPCWSVLVKYVGEDLDAVADECLEVAHVFNADDVIRGFFEQFAECCRRAKEQGKVILCTGD